MSVINVDGVFAPLNKQEVELIKALHRANPDTKLNLRCISQDATFLRILFKFAQQFDYLSVNDETEAPIYELKTDITFDLDNFHLYYGKNLLLNDPIKMQELLAKKISKKRYEHSLRVAQLASSLASKHHYPEYKAWLAGLLHDVCKEFSDDAANEYLKYYDPEKVSAHKAIKHSYVGKYYLKQALNFYDCDILEAIYHHTDGESNKVLSKIIYIADKREAGRNIEDNIVDCAFRDLSKAFKDLKKDVGEYIARNK